MKMRIIVDELSREDLVNLLSTATYGSWWLGVSTGDMSGVEKEEGDCLEDVWAKCLLAGHPIECTDYYAEGEAYGDLPNTTDEEENVTYQVTMEDVKNGLQKCYDGTFKASGKNEREYLSRCFASLRDEGPDFDLEMAEALMQVIMFGELIYG